MTYHIQNQETQMPLEKLFINCFWQTNNTGIGTNLTDKKEKKPAPKTKHIRCNARRWPWRWRRRRQRKPMRQKNLIHIFNCELLLVCHHQ